MEFSGNFDDPEEFIAAIHNHRAYHEDIYEMQRTQAKLDFRDFIMGLDAKQLEVFNHVLKSIGSVEDAAAQAAFYAGLGTAILDVKHGINLATGKPDEPTEAVMP